MRVLVVVDMQNDFITGSLGTKEAQAIVPNVKKKIDEYRKAGHSIIFTRDTHYGNYLESNEGKHLPVEHCLYGTDGWYIASGLPTSGDTIIDKLTFGYLGWANRFIYLCPNGGIESIEIVGLCTDICVVSNALILKAMFPEIDISVDATCCAGVTPETHEAALKTMEMCQITVKR